MTTMESYNRQADQNALAALDREIAALRAWLTDSPPAYRHRDVDYLHDMEERRAYLLRRLNPAADEETMPQRYVVRHDVILATGASCYVIVDTDRHVVASGKFRTRTAAGKECRRRNAARSPQP